MTSFGPLVWSMPIRRVVDTSKCTTTLANEMIPGNLNVRPPVGLYTERALEAAALADLLSRAEVDYRLIDDPTDWAKHHPGGTILICAPAPSNLVRQVLRTSASAMIVFTDDTATALHLASAGASTLPTTATPAQIAAALQAVNAQLRVLHGEHTLLPQPDLTDEELDLLIALVTNRHIDRLAPNIGYSRTQTYRRLRHLYQRLNAEDRQHALYLAGRLGISPNKP